MNRPFDSAEVINAVGIRLGEVRRAVDDSHRQAEQRQELFEAQLNRDIAQRLAEVSFALLAVERTLGEARERIASIKDGRDGVDGSEGPPGPEGPQGLPGEDGKDGVDGRSFVIRGTWSETQSYRELDVVVLNGASFGARRDDPGPCPGDGWQLIAAQGKRGNAGERGAGARGERGLPGPPAVALHVNEEGLLTLTNADGSQVSCDLYPLLAKLV
jgi:hypothetical protein